MQVLQLSVIVLIGLSLGVVSGPARIPDIKWIPWLAAAVLTAWSYVGLWVLWDIALVEALLFLVAVFGGSALYGGRLWQKLGLEPGLSYWEWVKRDFVHTGTCAVFTGPHGPTANSSLPTAGKCGAPGSRAAFRHLVLTPSF